MPLTNRLRLLWTLAFLVLFPGGGIASSNAQGHDNAFREGWSLLQKERYAEARAIFARIPPGEYDLGDYVVYFEGVTAARERQRIEASEAAVRLSGHYPQSPLIPYLQHEIAFAAALDNDLQAARGALAVSRGKVAGNARKSEEGYVVAVLSEEEGPTPAAAELHLQNFTSYTAQDGATLSYERLWQWRKEGRLGEWNLPVGFHARLARAVNRAGDPERARAVYEESLRKYPPSDDYYAMVLDYAEF